ncbi:hypothetical protein TSMEX_006264 [Taenia solium]|eukprot:TsM_000179200 transcript=TsM_000179200 gene=TsM_000179200
MSNCSTVGHRFSASPCPSNRQQYFRQGDFAEGDPFVGLNCDSGTQDNHNEKQQGREQDAVYCWTQLQNAFSV